MKTLLSVAVVVIVLAGAVVTWLGLPQGPKLEDVAHLAEPRLVTLPPQRVLLVRAIGDPNDVGKEAFGLLMNTYMRLKGVPNWGKGLKAPRARWPLDLQVPSDQWEGQYAMPVPDDVSALPEIGPTDGLTVELTTWDYGEVAEVLHVGSYQAEEPTIRLLETFVHEHGYEIVGDHEEEYLKGPGMIFRGNPERYLTIIRYSVRKREPGH
ncbi:hypothetical protein ACFL3S_03215 [Gemmatimonadota bacterium]